MDERERDLDHVLRQHMLSAIGEDIVCALE
jgi:hypothetical protein